MLVLNDKVLSKPTTNKERLHIHGQPVLRMLYTLTLTMLYVRILLNVIVVNYNEATSFILTARRLYGTASLGNYGLEWTGVDNLIRRALWMVVVAVLQSFLLSGG
jgi:hypothetical protein